MPSAAVPTLLSLQSWVSLGHVGHGAAQFALQRLGMESIMLPTVMLSSHLGYPGSQGGPVEVAQLEKLRAGIMSSGACANAQGFLTGFLGSPAHVLFARETWHTLQSEATTPTRFVCDPVLGDHGALYVPESMIKAYTSILIPWAHVLTPNRFELGWLAGSPAPIQTLHQADLAALTLLRAFWRLEHVVATGCHDESAPGVLHVLLVARAQTKVYAVPAISRNFAGAGDLFGATLTALLLQQMPIDHAVGVAMKIVCGILEQTDHQGSKELALVSSQHFFDHHGDAIPHILLERDDDR